MIILIIIDLLRFDMHASLLWSMKMGKDWNMIRMHDITMMIKIHKWIFIALLRNSDFIYINMLCLKFIFIFGLYMIYGFIMKLVERATW